MAVVSQKLLSDGIESQNLECNVERVYIFHLIFVGTPSSLILSIKNRGVGFFTKWTKSVKDTHREKAPALTKNTNMDIWVVGT